MSGLFYVLSTGELANTVSLTRTEAQSQARRLIDWIARDARLARTYDIGDVSNIPSDSHIKFYPVTDWDSVNGQYVVSPNYIEYSYDSATNTITRSITDSSGNVLNSWLFRDIISPPFSTLGSSDNIIPLGTEIQQSRILIISINVRKQTRGGANIDSSIITEVKIRNG
jgi:hypothetical protein